MAKERVSDGKEVTYIKWTGIVLEFQQKPLHRFPLATRTFAEGSAANERLKNTRVDNASGWIA